MPYKRVLASNKQDGTSTKAGNEEAAAAAATTSPNDKNEEEADAEQTIEDINKDRVAESKGTEDKEDTADLIKELSFGKQGGEQMEETTTTNPKHSNNEDNEDSEVNRCPTKQEEEEKQQQEVEAEAVVVVEEEEGQEAPLTAKEVEEIGRAIREADEAEEAQSLQLAIRLAKEEEQQRRNGGQQQPDTTTKTRTTSARVREPSTVNFAAPTALKENVVDSAEEETDEQPAKAGSTGTGSSSNGDEQNNKTRTTSTRVREPSTLDFIAPTAIATKLENVEESEEDDVDVKCVPDEEDRVVEPVKPLAPTEEEPAASGNNSTGDSGTGSGGGGGLTRQHVMLAGIIVGGIIVLAVVAAVVVVVVVGGSDSGGSGANNNNNNDGNDNGTGPLTPTTLAPTPLPTRAPSSQVDVAFWFGGDSFADSSRSGNSTSPPTTSRISTIDLSQHEGYCAQCGASVSGISSISFRGGFGSLTLELLNVHGSSAVGDGGAAAQSRSSNTRRRLYESNNLVLLQTPNGQTCGEEETTAAPQVDMSKNPNIQLGSNRYLQVRLTTTSDVSTANNNNNCPDASFVSVEVQVEFQATEPSNGSGGGDDDDDGNTPSTRHCEDLDPQTLKYEFAQWQTQGFPFNGESRLQTLPVPMPDSSVSSSLWCAVVVTSMGAISYRGDFGQSDEFFTVAVATGNVISFGDDDDDDDDDDPLQWVLLADTEGVAGVPDCEEGNLEPNYAEAALPLVLQDAPSEQSTLSFLLTSSSVVDIFCLGNFVQFSVTVEFMTLAPVPTVSPTKRPTPAPTRTLRPTLNPSHVPSPPPAHACAQLPPRAVTFHFNEYHEPPDNFPYQGASTTSVKSITTDMEHQCDAVITAFSAVNYNGDFGESYEYFTLQMIPPAGSASNGFVFAHNQGQSASDCSARTAYPNATTMLPFALEPGQQDLSIQLTTTFDVNSFCSYNFVNFTVVIEYVAAVPLPTMAPTTSPAPTSYCEGIPPYEATIRFEGSAFPYEGSTSSLSQQLVQGVWCDAVITDLSVVQFDGDFGESSEKFTLELIGRQLGADVTLVDSNGVHGTDCQPQTVSPKLDVLPVALDPGQNNATFRLNTTYAVNTFCSENYVELVATVQYVTRGSASPSHPPSPSPSASPTTSLAPSRSPTPTQRPSTHPTAAPTSYCQGIPPFEVEFVFDKAEYSFPFDGASFVIARDVTKGLSHLCDATIVNISSIHFDGDFGDYDENFELEFVHMSTGRKTTVVDTSGSGSYSDCQPRTVSPTLNLGSGGGAFVVEPGQDLLAVQLTTTADVDFSMCQQNGAYVKFNVTVQLMEREETTPTPSVAPQLPTASPAPFASSCESMAAVDLEFDFDQVDETFPFAGDSFVLSRALGVDQGVLKQCNAVIVAVSDIYYIGDFGASSEHFTAQFIKRNTGTIATAQGFDECGAGTVPSSLPVPIALSPGQDLLAVELSTTSTVGRGVCNNNQIRFRVTVEFESF